MNFNLYLKTCRHCNKEYYKYYFGQSGMCIDCRYLIVFETDSSVNAINVSYEEYQSEDKQYGLHESNYEKNLI